METTTAVARTGLIEIIEEILNDQRAGNRKLNQNVEAVTNYWLKKLESHFIEGDGDEINSLQTMLNRGEIYSREDYKDLSLIKKGCPDNFQLAHYQYISEVLVNAANEMLENEKYLGYKMWFEPVLLTGALPIRAEEASLILPAAETIETQLGNSEVISNEVQAPEVVLEEIQLDQESIITPDTVQQEDLTLEPNEVLVEPVVEHEVEKVIETEVVPEVTEAPEVTPEVTPDTTVDGEEKKEVIQEPEPISAEHFNNVLGDFIPPSSKEKERKKTDATTPKIVDQKTLAKKGPKTRVLYNTEYAAHVHMQNTRAVHQQNYAKKRGGSKGGRYSSAAAYRGTLPHAPLALIGKECLIFPMGLPNVVTKEGTTLLKNPICFVVDQTSGYKYTAQSNPKNFAPGFLWPMFKTVVSTTIVDGTDIITRQTELEIPAVLCTEIKRFKRANDAVAVAGGPNINFGVYKPEVISAQIWNENKALDYAKTHYLCGTFMVLRKGYEYYYYVLVPKDALSIEVSATGQFV